MPDDKQLLMQDELDPDPGIDHDPVLGDPEDPAEEAVSRVPVDGGVSLPMSEISGEKPGPSTVNQLPVTGGANWQPSTDTVDGYENPRERERANDLPSGITSQRR